MTILLPEVHAAVPTAVVSARDVVRRYRKPDSPRQSSSKEHGMLKPKPIIFAVAVAFATLAPAASASELGGTNHNETLLLDA